MAITRTEKNENWANGVLVSSRDVTVDVTAETVIADLAGKAQAAFNTNATFLALGSPTNAQVLAQVRALTRMMNAVIRLLYAVVLSRTDIVNETSDT